MLHSADHIYVIELKDQKDAWAQDAIKQLESTIELLIENHSEVLNQFRHKKAFACNKRKKTFRIIDNEKQKRFFQKYRFRLDIQAHIVIV